MAFGPPGGHQQLPPGSKPPKQAPVEAANTEQPSQAKKASVEQKQVSKPPGKAPTPTSVSQAQRGPPPPLESKPSVATALAPPASQTGQPAAKPAAGAGKGGRIVPAVPLPSPGVKGAVPTNGPLQGKAGNKVQPGRAQPSQAAANAALQNATQAATAAVAAAMAKLPPAPGQGRQQAGEAVDNLTRKVNEMRTNDHTRGSRQPGSGGYGAGRRGSRVRGGDGQHQARKVDVPKTDYDFESANAKFNKQDLVKEVIATGSPSTTPTEQSTTNGVSEASVDGAAKDHDIIIPAATYNKAASFFDNISSETKDRNEANGHRPGGREWRGEEVKRNLETFGQGSVDNGYRGGFRGRGRGRGSGNRGRGGQRGARGGNRGDQQNVATGGT
ncbi:MAG: hypothetical protein M1832_006050 [Thelocarpon impressellum]|nr:MAG: hypothetical protein M1832_006050 [Thelocarpon impressellum]